LKLHICSFIAACFLLHSYLRIYIIMFFCCYIFFTTSALAMNDNNISCIDCYIPVLLWFWM
jgi:hypothetical protein